MAIDTDNEGMEYDDTPRKRRRQGVRATIQHTTVTRHPDGTETRESGPVEDAPMHPIDPATLRHPHPPMSDASNPADDGSRGVSMDRGTPAPGEVPYPPDMDDTAFVHRMATADSITRDRQRPHDRYRDTPPPMAPRDATAVRPPVIATPSPDDELAEQAGNDLMDAVKRRAARNKRP
jgi:hypothetical protein